MRKLTGRQEFARCWRDVELDERRIEHSRLYSRHHGVAQDAVLLWFDPISGEGMISLADGTSLRANYSEIDGVDKNNYAGPTAADSSRLATLDRNTLIVVTPYISYCGHMAEKIIIPSLK